MLQPAVNFHGPEGSSRVEVSQRSPNPGGPLTGSGVQCDTGPAPERPAVDKPPNEYPTDHRARGRQQAAWTGAPPRRARGERTRKSARRSAARPTQLASPGARRPTSASSMRTLTMSSAPLPASRRARRRAGSSSSAGRQTARFSTHSQREHPVTSLAGTRPGSPMCSSACETARSRFRVPLVATLVSEYRRRGARARLAAELAARGVQLTAREWEVLELLGESYPTAEIARRLAVSPVTVRTHVASVVRKLGVADRDAARRVIAHAAAFERRRTRREARSGLEPVHGTAQAPANPPTVG